MHQPNNYEILNRKNQIYIRRFRNDLSRFQRKVHKGGGIGVWSYITYHGLGPLLVYDMRLNSIKYIDILETNLPKAFQKFPSHQVQQILYQQDSCLSNDTRIFQKKRS